MTKFFGIFLGFLEKRFANLKKLDNGSFSCQIISIKNIFCSIGPCEMYLWLILHLPLHTFYAMLQELGCDVCPLCRVVENPKAQSQQVVSLCHIYILLGSKANKTDQ